MKALVFLVFALTSVTTVAQTFTEKDSVRISQERSEQLRRDYRLGGSKQHPLDRRAETTDLRLQSDYGLDKANVASDMNLYVRPFYVGPASEYTARPITYPLEHDYRFYDRNRVMEKGWINTSSSHTTYPALGSLSKITVNYDYLLSDRIITSVGTYGARYFYNMNTYYDMGVNAALSYKLSSRFSVMAFGQYSARGNINKVGGDNAWMMPNTNFGVAGVYMFNEVLGVMGGVSRQLDAQTGKWKNVPFASPVIQIKK